MLVPLYTSNISAASGGYGIITNLYAYTALLLVILTYGMETTFFRYANKTNEDPQKVYSSTLIMVGFTSLLFIVLVSIFLQPLSGVMGYSDHSSYVWVMAATVSIDAFQCIPFAYLRYKNRPNQVCCTQTLVRYLQHRIELTLFFWCYPIYIRAILRLFSMFIVLKRALVMLFISTLCVRQASLSSSIRN